MYRFFLLTRRNLLKVLAIILVIFPYARHLFANHKMNELTRSNNIMFKNNDALCFDFVESTHNNSEVFLVKGGTPEKNVRKLFDMIGGVGSIFGNKDIIILKPNAQWWNQGMTNTDAMKAFIEIILDMPNFEGEIIVAENHQCKELDSRGWTTSLRNGEFNLNELVKHFNDLGYSNVTKYHWQCAGENPAPLEADGCCGKRVNGPEDGDGYVWRDDIVYTAPNGNKCWMTYPVFTSQYSGITVDLKNGAWKAGKYLSDKQVRFINFSALNHHGSYAGITASIKNLMGVVDMTCGFHAPMPLETFNVHFVGVKRYIKYAEKLHWRLEFLKNYLKKTASVKEFYYAGGALGYFLKNIREPDLNIITAEWIGWGHRTDIAKSCRPKALLASRDPVALDFVAASEIVLPCTPVEETMYRKLNDPFDKKGPFYKFISECHKQGVGNLDVNKIRVVKYIIDDEHYAEYEKV